jgi:hypothetical protein
LTRRNALCRLADEIASAISSQLGMSDLYNDADLERELELLAEEEISDDMTTIAPLPDVPIDATIGQKQPQVDPLDGLREWAQ